MQDIASHALRDAKPDALEMMLVRAAAHKTNLEGYENKAASCVDGRVRLAYFMPTTTISIFGLYITVTKYLAGTPWETLASFMPAAGFALLYVCVRLSRQWYLEERRYLAELARIHDTYGITPSVAHTTIDYYVEGGFWRPARTDVSAMGCTFALIILSVNHFHVI